LEEFKALIGKERDSKDVRDFLSRHQFIEVHRADVLSTSETAGGLRRSGELTQTLGKSGAVVWVRCRAFKREGPDGKMVEQISKVIEFRSISSLNLRRSIFHPT
jgi:hypothetical protein